MKINVRFFLLIMFSLFVSFESGLFAASGKDEKKEAEQLQAQYESYILNCMSTTVNQGERTGLENASEMASNASNAFRMLFQGPYAWLTAENPLFASISDQMKEGTGTVKKKTLSSATVDYQTQIHTCFSKMIDKINAQIPDTGSQEGIKKINKEEKLKELDALFINADKTITPPAQRICEHFNLFFLKIDSIKKTIESSQKNKKYISSLIKLFEDRLTSSKKMVILKEFNLKLEAALGLSPEGGFGDVRTVDAVLVDLKALFSQEMYEQLCLDIPEIINEINAIEKSFAALLAHQEKYERTSFNEKEKLKEELLKKYKEVYRVAPVSTQVQRKMNNIIVMLEADLEREPADPTISLNRLAECEWYLQEIPKFKEWKDPWYVSGPIVVPLTLFTTFFGYFIYKGYRSHQDKMLNELKDKILFLNTIPKKERDLLLARLNDDFLIKYVPVEVLCTVDSMVDFFTTDRKHLAHFHKKVTMLYEECLDKKEAHLYAAAR